MTDVNLKDDFLNRVLTKASLDKPSADFTANVMNRIDSEVFTKMANQPIFSLKYWLLIGLGFIAASFVLFGLDWSFMNGIFGNVSFESVQVPELSFNIFGELQTFFSEISISPIIFIGIAAIFSLIVIDKIVKKIFSAHISLLI
ncbi:MAG: hypothetical protein GY834_17360 [Bacteroidetes bacterium]|nr:hypothetical protein [Bacteroidota bacterium]